MNFAAIKLLVSKNWMWISIALLSLSVIWDWISIRRSLWQRKTNSPGCGKCGYSTTGLERMICPECGSDLRQVGIVDRPAHRPRIANRIFVAMIFTASIFLAGHVTMFVLYQLWPVKYSYTSRADLTKPASGQYWALGIDASVSSFSRNNTVLPVDITLRLILPQSPPSRSVEQREFHSFTSNPSCQFANLDGHSVVLDEPFSKEAILKWFAACGIDASDPKVILEAKRIENLCLSPSRMNPAVSSHLNGRMSDEVFGSTNWVQFSGKRTIPMSGVFVYTAWVALWLTGMMQIIKTRLTAHQD